MIIDQDLRNLVKPELRAGEKLLWADKPRRFPLNIWTSYFLGFSIVWTLMAVTITRATGEDSGVVPFNVIGIVFPIIGILFVIAGLFVFISPSKEIYAVTNHRGVILKRFLLRNTLSLSPEKMSNPERRGGSDIGTLNFESGMPRTTGQMFFRKSFKNISNPKQVEDLIYKTFQKGSS